MSLPGWDEIDLEKSVDDPWTISDANAFPRKSEEVQATWEVSHDGNGIHRPPAAQAWARVTWTGAAYVVTEGVGVVSAVKLGSTGLVSVTVDFAFANNTDWMPVVTPIWSEPAGAVDVSPNVARAVNATRIQLYKVSGGSISAIDCSFTFKAFGERAA